MGRTLPKDSKDFAHARAQYVHVVASDLEKGSTQSPTSIMQLMPGTADDLGVSRPFSAYANIDGGVRYLVEQLQRFGSVKRALQAYHCGPNRVMEGRIPRISIRYANQVLARFRHIKLHMHWTPNSAHVLVAQKS